MKNILLIVDPQNDFITGSLAVEGAKEKMMKLSEYIKNLGYKYDAICVTMDTHPDDHCSFKENGGIWPTHCITNSVGEGIPVELIKSAPELYTFLWKGGDLLSEEYGAFNYEDSFDFADIIDFIYQNDEYCAPSQRIKNIDEFVICGIAGDYCVLETLKNVVRHVKDTSKIKVFLDGVASIDDGSTLRNYMKENNKLTNKKYQC